MSLEYFFDWLLAVSSGCSRLLNSSTTWRIQRCSCWQAEAYMARVECNFGRTRLFVWVVAPPWEATSRSRWAQRQRTVRTDRRGDRAGRQSLSPSSSSRRIRRRRAKTWSRRSSSGGDTATRDLYPCLAVNSSRTFSFGRSPSAIGDHQLFQTRYL